MKKTTTLLAFSLVLFPVFGQFEAPQNIAYATLFQPEAILSAELDGDTYEDILAVSGYESRIAWFKGLPDGSFGNMEIISDGLSTLRNASVADIDGDGDNDFLTGSGSDGSVICFSNDGSGHFTQVVIGSVANGVNEIFAIDMDTDGDPDALVADAVVLQWLENNGNGIFGTTHSIASPLIYTSAIAFDADNDGDNDLAAADYYSHTVHLLLNNGDGSFPAPVTVSDSAVQVRCLAVGDVDGNNYREIVAGTGEGISVFRNQGSAVFTELEIGFTDYYTGKVLVTDVDGDAVPDVLASMSAFVAWYGNDGSGSFGPRQIAVDDYHNYPGIHVADPGDDGHPDLLTAGNRGAQVHYNDGLNAFAESVLLNTRIDTPREMHLADIDDNGTTDVVLADEIGISWFPNAGGGTFGRQYMLFDEQSETETALVCDFDGDTDQDILFYSQQDSMIAWVENEGSGNFSAFEMLAEEEGNLFALRAADTDNDGDLDILAANLDFNEIALYENLGGSLAPKQVLATVIDARSVCIEDTDNDGDPDLLASGDQSIVLCENTGSGFLPAVSVAANDDIPNLWTSDLNGDGDPDLISGSVWHENLGGNTFGPAIVLVPDPEWVWETVPADLDNDGDTDLLASSNTSSQVYVLQNDGSGSFDMYTITDGTGTGYGIAAADMDEDGDNDFAVVHAGVRLDWYENLGTLGMGEQAESTLTVFPNPFHAITTLELPEDSGSYELTVTDAQGRIVWQRSGKTAGTCSIDLSAAGPGIYLLRADFGNARHSTTKLIVR